MSQLLHIFGQLLGGAIILGFIINQINTMDTANKLKLAGLLIFVGIIIVTAFNVVCNK